MLRKIANTLPPYARSELKRIHYRRQIRSGAFTSPEIEFRKIDSLVSPGDWVIDVGANVGHYTRRFSEIVAHGRVIAIEPHPKTFAHLAANVADLENVTLINAALSDSFGEIGFSVPGDNFYQAAVSENGDMKVATIPSAALSFEHKIAFIKIDAEGHEDVIIPALNDLIERHRPILMVENNLRFLEAWADRHRYRFDDYYGSHNHILKPA